MPLDRPWIDPALSALSGFSRRNGFSLTKPKEAMAVPVRPRHRLGDLRQAAEGLTVPGEAFLEDHDLLNLALPLSHKHRAGLQADAFSRLRNASVEGSGGVIVPRGAKDPPDRFVESAEGVRLEPIGQHPYQQPTGEMGRRLAAQMGAPLAAQPIEIMALEIRHDRQNRWVERSV